MTLLFAKFDINLLDGFSLVILQACVATLDTVEKMDSYKDSQKDRPQRDSEIDIDIDIARERGTDRKIRK